MKTKGKAEDILKGLFASKKLMCKVWAKKPIEEKLKDLVRIQEIAVTVSPKYKKFKNIIPWKIK